MAQRMVTMRTVRICDERLKEGKKVTYTLDKLLKIEDLTPIVLKGTKIEGRLSKLLLIPKYRDVAYKILKRIRNLKKEEDKTFTPLQMLKDSNNDVLPPPPAPPSPVDLVLATKDKHLVMSAIKRWLEKTETKELAIQTIGRLSEICPDGKVPYLA